ncbi:MAG TPA: SDR family oxidoreductase [Acetobacteraceae bacterium]|jgi:NAD(P)-dependent dehydrogenase (short-subunit alcohol dehydrogenase family)|nr:SDR family oxidoreductase [Acetobacteraceae bacterium]
MVGSRIALVTGGNKGIGFEICRQIGREGFVILLGARDPDLGAEAAARLRGEGIDARPIALDVTSAGTISAVAAAIESEFQRLDVLVNNAGITGRPDDGPPSVAGIDTVRRVMETNFLGPLAVTQAMLPLLRKSAAGRIVNVSSGLGSLTLNGDPDWEFAGVKLLGYNASKAALNMLTVQLAFELRGTSIKVNAADPGFTATDLNQNRGTQTVEEGARTPVRLALLGRDGPSGGYFDTAGTLPW